MSVFVLVCYDIDLLYVHVAQQRGPFGKLLDFVFINMVPGLVRGPFLPRRRGPIAFAFQQLGPERLNLTNGGAAFFSQRKALRRLITQQPVKKQIVIEDRANVMVKEFKMSLSRQEKDQENVLFSDRDEITMEEMERQTSEV